MGQRQVKALKRVMKRNPNNMIHKIMDELCDCSFWLRVKIAWRIVKG